MLLKEDIMLIQLAFKIGNIAGSTPWYDFKKQSVSRTKFHKMFKLMWIIIYSCPLIHTCLYFCNTNKTRESGIRVKNIFEVLHTTVLLAYAINIILDILFKEPVWKQFLLCYSKLHQQLKLKNCRVTFLCMIILFLLFLYGNLFVLLVNSILLSDDLPFLVAISINNILMFNSIVCIFMMCTFAACLKSRYKNLNCTLRNMLILSKKTMVSTRLEEYVFAESIRDLGKIYRTLRVLVNMYNDLFAWKTIFLYLITFFEIIRQLTVLLNGLKMFSITSNFFIIWIVVSIFLLFIKNYSVGRSKN